ncbi:MAG: discoidin domain-containing protein [Myxococcales bacterium]
MTDNEGEPQDSTAVEPSEKAPSTSPWSAALARVSLELHEFFSLRARETLAATVSPEQRATVQKHFSLAREHAAVVEELGDRAERPAVVITLSREAARHFVAAVLAQRGFALADIDRARLWEEFERNADAFGEVPEEVWALRELAEVQAVESQTDTDAFSQSFSKAREAFSWFASQIEARCPEQIRRTRFIRRLVAALVVLALLGLAVRALLAPKNLARGARVTVSTLHPACPDPGAVANGKLETTYGAHTDRSDSAWVQLDLGSSKRVERVVVFNRGDGWFDDGLPFVLEVGETPDAWTRVSDRSAHFAQGDPWETRGIGKSARYVRVRSARPGGYVALSEIEVYAR